MNEIEIANDFESNLPSLCFLLLSLYFRSLCLITIFTRRVTVSHHALGVFIGLVLRLSGYSGRVLWFSVGKILSDNRPN
ncbi:hypothetical protein HanRHA438_Chr03g0143501 [Helianthus annuus]|nr:hypothetical protein HanRHA438_Chr03g0143501 [Helianthus annuus]